MVSKKKQKAKESDGAEEKEEIVDVSEKKTKSKKKILVVEDDSFLLKVLVDKFKKELFDVVPVLDGAAALEKIKSEHPHIILLDIVLSGKDGFEILEELKADANLKKIPVVILSNLGQEGDVERGKKMGAVDYMVKINFTLDQVVSKVKEYLVRFGTK